MKPAPPITRRPHPAHCLAAVLCLVCSPLGCGASNSAPAPAPAPDRAALSVIVRAEPKAGWRDTARQGSTYDPGAIGEGPAYETIDYSALEEIVVWVEPSDAPPLSSPAGPIRIDLGGRAAAMLVSGTGDRWSINNPTAEALPIYARHESGRVVDLGTVAPGGQVGHAPAGGGLVEILSDARPDPLARVYVAPIPSAAGAARIVRSGRKTVFNDLAPGRVRVGCWHPRLPGSTAEVLLAPGRTTPATLVVGVNRLPKVP